MYVHFHGLVYFIFLGQMTRPPFYGRFVKLSPKEEGNCRKTAESL